MSKDTTNPEILKNVHENDEGTGIYWLVDGNLRYEQILLHRVIEWVDFSPIFESPAAFVVVAVGMWATRLRCPSCPQRCLSYGHDLIEGGAALLIAISMTVEGPMESCDATIALAACR